MEQSGSYFNSDHGTTNITTTNSTTAAATTTDSNTNTSRVIRILGYEYQRDLVIARLFYIFYFASFGSLFPLLAVYFKQLGLNASQAGILLGVRPLVEFAARPFWSSFANKFRKVNNYISHFNCYSRVFFKFKFNNDNNTSSNIQ